MTSGAVTKAVAVDARALFVCVCTSGLAALDLKGLVDRDNLAGKDGVVRGTKTVREVNVSIIDNDKSNISSLPGNGSVPLPSLSKSLGRSALVAARGNLTGLRARDETFSAEG